MSASDRIVITGTGLVCGGGISPDVVLDKILSSETAIRPYSQWDGTNWPVKVACEVEENNRTLEPNRKLHKSISRSDIFGLYAAEEAIGNSGLPEFSNTLGEDAKTHFENRMGIVVGSGGGTYTSNYDFLPLMAENDAGLPAFGRELSNMVTPMWLLKNLPNNVLCHVGIKHQFKGTNACIANQCTSGVQAVAEAASSIRAGEADRIAAIGHDAPFEPEMVFHYHRCGLMSSQAPRPFDENRDGTVFGEGGAALMLEKGGEAASRDAEVLGEILGTGCVSEGLGILELSPEGDGVKRAIELALADAGISPSDVGMICAHGNGTVQSDASEANGVRAVFGDEIPPVTGFKWAIGHLIAASGISDLVLTLEALRRKTVPGIATLKHLDPKCGDFPVSASSQIPRSDIGLVICRGFSGMDVATVVKAG